MQYSLFSSLKECRPPLTDTERAEAVRKLVDNARSCVQHFYKVKECCAMLHLSIDELYTLIRFYRIDAVLFLGVYRLPWYSLAAFLLCEKEDTLDEDLHEYLDTISRRTIPRD